MTKTFKYLEREHVESILHYIMNYGDYFYAQKMLNALSLCECCFEHRNNKPIFVSDKVKLEYKKGECKKGECSCACRHMAREICRIYSTIKP